MKVRDGFMTMWAVVMWCYRNFSQSEKRPTIACLVYQQIQGGPQIIWMWKSVGLLESAGDRCEKCALNFNNRNSAIENADC